MPPGVVTRLDALFVLQIVSGILRREAHAVRRLITLPSELYFASHMRTGGTGTIQLLHPFGMGQFPAANHGVHFLEVFAAIYFLPLCGTPKRYHADTTLSTQF